jgi:aerobic carbon-monoxide dehydrogenase medium subunit
MSAYWVTTMTPRWCPAVWPDTAVRVGLEKKSSVRPVKPAVFNYHRPGSVEEALALHTAFEDARFIAGGQSLVPMMALRLARPSDLIDLNSVDELSGISHTATGIRIGPMTRQEDLAADEALCAQVPAMRAVVTSVGHPGTRTRGTLGGSLCHADPSAELPALLLAVDAEVQLTSAGGATRIAAVEDFFGGYFETTIGPDELLTEIRIPVGPRRRMGFHEVALRSSDFAAAGAVASAHLDDDGALNTARVVGFAVGDRPRRLLEVEAAVMDTQGDPGAIRSAAQLTERAISPADEPHLSAAYRRQLAVAVVRRALEAALGVIS